MQPLFDINELTLLFPELAEVVAAGKLEICEPINEPQSGEKVIGVVEWEFVRYIYRCREFLMRRVALAKIAERFARDKDSQRRAAEAMARYDQQDDVLKEIFWLSARTELSAWTQASIAIRSQWRIVESLDTPPFPGLRISGVAGFPGPGK